MNFSEFTQKIVEEIPKVIENVSVKINTVNKNNGLVLTGVTIVDETKNTNMHPTIYLDKFYEMYNNGLIGFNEVIDEISEIYTRNKINHVSFDADMFKDYDKVKKGLTIRLINYEKNAERLKTIPYKMFNDLAMICIYVVQIDDESCGSVTISDEHLNVFKITKDKLFDDALENLNNASYIVSDMTSILNAMGFEYDEEFINVNNTIPMYVITNEYKTNGASVMLNKKAMEEVYNHLIGDFYIIPSSVHEVIAIPIDHNDIMNIKGMVKEVNNTQLLPEEILSESIYLYDSATGNISIA